ncbi:hypothetical protein [Peribacillus frigoritolerans]|uniref:hypothetical protein n=1 Tax=Peribacillus frigoritolerans TaxID=450367 RepID=UPI002B242DED|nr:hypothetical protein [Peribacillus frigoritolerans]MEB2628303.1 hypothetical protein [Peribacillus frigoritolerans]
MDLVKILFHYSEKEVAEKLRKVNGRFINSNGKTDLKNFLLEAFYVGNHCSFKEQH